MTTPRTAPKTATTIASSRIIVRSWLRLTPTARSRPTSRVRSITDRLRVLTTPRIAMITESPSRP